ncbi:MAG: hypothetical protein M3R02_01235 [Chloroflexota bacterium]|nr:hypothetical protein [Chloroflexota bacterium]
MSSDHQGDQEATSHTIGQAARLLGVLEESGVPHLALPAPPRDGLGQHARGRFASGAGDSR